MQGWGYFTVLLNDVSDIEKCSVAEWTLAVIENLKLIRFSEDSSPGLTFMSAV